MYNSSLSNFVQRKKGFFLKPCLNMDSLRSKPKKRKAGWHLLIKPRILWHP